MKKIFMNSLWKLFLKNHIYDNTQYNYQLFFHFPAKVCNGIGHDYDEYFKNCCGTKAPCDINEGDCDSDDECKGGLVCGSNNCPSPFPSSADCCENPDPGNLNNYFRLHVCLSVLPLVS